MPTHQSSSSNGGSNPPYSFEDTKILAAASRNNDGVVPQPPPRPAVPPAPMQYFNNAFPPPRQPPPPPPASMNNEDDNNMKKSAAGNRNLGMLALAAEVVSMASAAKPAETINLSAPPPPSNNIIMGMRGTPSSAAMAMKPSSPPPNSAAATSSTNKRKIDTLTDEGDTTQQHNYGRIYPRVWEPALHKSNKVVTTCTEPNCTNQGSFKGGVCKHHRHLCSFPKCTNTIVNHGVCMEHGAIIKRCDNHVGGGGCQNFVVKGVGSCAACRAREYQRQIQTISGGGGSRVNMHGGGPPFVQDSGGAPPITYDQFVQGSVGRVPTIAHAHGTMRGNNQIQAQQHGGVVSNSSSNVPETHLPLCRVITNNNVESNVSANITQPPRVAHPTRLPPETHQPPGRMMTSNVESGTSTNIPQAQGPVHPTRHPETHQPPSNSRGMTSSSVESNISTNIPQQPQGSSAHPTRLTIPQDEQFLDPVSIFLRSKCVEVFTSNGHDKGGRRAYRKTADTHVEGQIGLRCLHCRHVPKGERANQAVSYPSKTTHIYESVRNYQRIHFEACRYIPTSLKEEFVVLNEGFESSALRKIHRKYVKVYFDEAAREIGIVESPYGLFFGAPPNTSGVPSKKLQIIMSITQNPSAHQKKELDDLLFPKVDERVKNGKFAHIATPLTRQVIEACQQQDAAFIHPSDYPTVSDFRYILFQQFIPCRPPASKLERRKIIPKNWDTLAGLICKHCALVHHHGHGGGMYCPLDFDSFCDSSFFKYITTHIMTCQHVPRQIKVALNELQLLAAQYGTTTKRGAKTLFLKKLWDRMSHHYSVHPHSYTVSNF